MSSYQKALSNLIESLNNRKELKNIKIIEDELYSNKEVLSLVAAFSSAQEDYNFILSHFKNDENKIQEYKNKLVEAKRTLDAHPLVQKYNDLYFIVTEPTLYLEKELKRILSSGDMKSC